MKKKITIILGHPDSASLCGAMADHYAQAAQAAGHEVRYFRLGELEFDPILHHGYKQVQALEPDLQEIQAAIQWAQHIVLVYPIWWGSFPALLKGMFDRIMLPGYAFSYRQNSAFWNKLLKGRSARAIATMDTPPWYFRLMYWSAAHVQIRRTILGFTGIGPVRTTSFGPVRYANKYASDAKRAAWLAKVAELGRRGI